MVFLIKSKLEVVKQVEHAFHIRDGRSYKLTAGEVGSPSPGEVAPIDHGGLSKEYFGFRVVSSKVHETSH